MNTAEIRKAFLDYFVQQGHTVVPSSSLVPGNDPTLLFTNAGMVQFKDVFLGQDERPYQRAVTVQRCLRAGGKHNDLDNVGYTARHHTFFEMLGNFSFGDYFKKDAIRFAWEFLTQVLAIPASHLWVTVYLDDDEAADIWQHEIGIAPDRISRCGEEDNFWSMGDTGPCGPCTEIFYDHGPEVAGGPPGSPDADGDRYIEIWNMVFMQFNRDKQGTMHPLPKPSVDTGMGLERLAAVIQGVHNNYHIDSFQYLIDQIIKLAPAVDRDHPSLKVVADHLRSSAFLLADGVTPSNEGRGYVLRRIIRRAVRHGNALGLPSPFFHRLVAALITMMGKAYPELEAHQSQIEQHLQQEEEQFARTLEQGLRLLQAQIKQASSATISGDVAFKLYDTYGFPVDLTADIAREQGLEVDMDGFQQCMQQQRAQSHAASQFDTDFHAMPALAVTSDFHGYEQDELESQVMAMMRDGAVVERLNPKEQGVIVLKLTPFYAEAGGQVGDKGTLSGEGFLFQVDETQQQGSAILHYGHMVKGQIGINQNVLATVDASRRDAIRLHHSATHLLHAALRTVLGEHVQQKGSLVEADRARFDFAHNAAVSSDDLERVETLVNTQIRLNHDVETAVMSLEDAKNAGAAALFDEKYADMVRVLTMGEFSKELCGGTHAQRTGDIGLFKITAEYGVASGVRRIEFVTGDAAMLWVNQRLHLLNHSAQVLKTQPEKILEKIQQSLQTIKQQEKELQQYQQLALQQEGLALRDQAQWMGDTAVLIKQLDNLDARGLRALLDQLKSALEKAVIVLFAVRDGNLAVVAGISKSLLGKVPAAGVLVKQLCGKGGGRDDMAQGGGPVPSDLVQRVEGLQTMLAVLDSE
ncbi:MAG: alanine--tRNA ligase [Gammaproteobacteria bacterium]|nr:alanine--tRNA ligase [Gammaproteobacteria bacterium]